MQNYGVKAKRRGGGGGTTTRLLTRRMTFWRQQRSNMTLEGDNNMVTAGCHQGTMEMSAEERWRLTLNFEGRFQETK